MSRLAVGVFILSLGLFAQAVPAQTPQVSPGGIVNGATFASSGALAPGVIFSAFGTSLTDGTTASASSIPLPTRLAGARVLVNAIAAPLIFASPGQINAQFPTELTALTTATIQVEVQRATGTVISPPTTVAVASSSPGIFTLDQNGSGPGSILRSSDFTRICPQRRADCSPNTAAPGEVVAIYATGLGQVNGLWVSGQAVPEASPTINIPVVAIGGTQAQVLFSGLATGFVGLYQVNVVLPENTLTGDAVPLALSVAGMTSNKITIAVTSPPCQKGARLPFVKILSMAIDPINPSNIYVGTDGLGIYKSCDGAKSWSAANAGALYTSIFGLVVDATNPRYVYAVTGFGFLKTATGGQIWSSPRNSGLPDFYFFTSIAMDPTNSNTIYIGNSYYGVFKSVDGGNSWFVTKFGLTNTAVQALVIDPKTPTTIYALEGQVSFKSINGGQTWDSVSRTGLPTSAIFNVLAVDPLNPNTLYCGGNGGVYKSTNGGQSWASINSGLVAGGGAGLPYIQALAIDPVRPNTIYAGTITQNSAGNGIFKSINGGQTWAAVNFGLTTPNIRVLAIDPTASDTVYAGTDVGVFISTNGGQAWQASGLQ